MPSKERKEFLASIRLHPDYNGKSGEVYHLADCLFCRKPLPLPRNANMRRHRECLRDWTKQHLRETGMHSIYNKKAKMRYRERYGDAAFRASVNERGKAHRRSVRLSVLMAYGGSCACCGEKATEFLVMDHVNGGGTRQRREIGGHLYAFLLREGLPLGYRVLCHNCNSSFGYYGYCPHEHQQPSETMTY